MPNIMKDEIFTDYKYNLELFNRINKLIYSNEYFLEHFFYKDYNLWHSYQAQIFERIKLFSNNISYNKTNTSILKIINSFCIGLFSSIISIIAFLIIILNRRKVLVYSIDKTSSKYKSDFRIEEIYNTLINNKVGFLEIFHTLLDKNFILNFFARRRFAIYIESMDFIFSLLYKLNFIRIHNTTIINDLNFNNFKENEIKFIRNLFLEYLIKFELSKFRIKLLSLFLRFTNIKILLSIDDVRHYNDLILACKINNIETYAFQHGHYTKYHVGWLSCTIKNYKIITPDKLIVWSDYWKNELIRLGTYFDKAQIIVGGYKDIIDVNIKNRRKTSQVNILMCYVKDAPKVEIFKFIRRLLMFNNIRIYFKLRSDIDTNLQLNNYNIKDNFHERFILINNINEIINEVDLVTGPLSTLFYDMIMYHKPIAVLKIGAYYGEELVLNSLADEIDPDNKNIIDELIRIKNTPKKILEHRKQRLLGKKRTFLGKYIKNVLIKEELIK